MHEANIANSILTALTNRLQEVPPSSGAAFVTSAKIAVGEFRNVDAECLLFAFDSMKSSFPGLETCRLQICPVDALALCLHNNHQYHPQPNLSYRCGICGSGIGALEKGEELDITSIDIESTANPFASVAIGSNA